MSNDPKLASLVSARYMTMLSGEKLTFDPIRNVFSRFGNNIRRMYSSVALPMHVESTVRMSFDAQVKAQFEVLKDYGPFDFESEHGIKIRNRANEIVNESFSRLSQEPFYSQHLNRSMMHLQHMFVTYEHIDFIQPWLQSIIVGAWTAFETLASDLWVSSLNFHPQWLAQLSGNGKRLTRNSHKKTKAGESSTPADAENLAIKLKDIHTITNGKFDIRGRMGNLLADKFKFTSLLGIREAYAKAFSDKESRYNHAILDEQLLNRSLDALSAIRNVIVHRAAIVDDDYIKDQKTTDGLAPQLACGDRLELTGESVDNLVTEAVKSCAAIIEKVDSWLKHTGAGNE